MSTTQKSLRNRLVIQAGIGVMAISALMACLSPSDRPANGTDTLSQPIASPILEPITSPTYVRPLHAPNGKPWPTTSGYVKGYPVKLSDGLSTLTVDNSKNHSDVFIKLYALGKSPQPIRFFYIKQGDKFMVENIRSGQYDIRYQELETGALSKTEPLELTQERLKDGTSFTEGTITLYEVPDGNMQVYPLSEAEF